MSDQRVNQRLVLVLRRLLPFSPVFVLMLIMGPGDQAEGGSGAESKGYLSVCQTADGIIHLISSAQHYAFNLAWLKSTVPSFEKLSLPHERE